MMTGFALHEIICDRQGNPIDYIFLLVNKAFEDLTGLKSHNIIGKRVLEILPETEHYWIEKYGNVALKGTVERFANYSKALDKHYDVYAYSPKKGYFVTNFLDITKHRITEDLLIAANEELEYAYKEIVTTKEELESSYEEIVAVEEELRVNYELLEEKSKELRESEEKMIQIIENTGELIFSLTLDKTFSFVSSNCFEKLGYEPSELFNSHYSNIVEPETFKNLETHFDQLLKTNAPIRSLEYTLKHKNGKILTHLLSCSIVGSSDGLPLLLVGISTDITWNKEIERELNERQQQWNFALEDLDGLKLVNDTLGHKTGDSVLIQTGQIIRKSANEGDIISRIGGDEYAVLIENTNETTITNFVNRIRDNIAIHNKRNPELPISISIGYSISENKEISISEIFSEADNNMYKEKVHHSKSIRSTIVNTLMKALEARDFITEGHANRLQDLVTEMASKLNFQENKIADLKLLCKFHDIGKVGIPDSILFKEARLTEEEYSEMKKHSEIGYRIALSSPDLVHIADYILLHHEWWNGGGYPYGLKENEIPIECRLLAIVDAFDAMSNDRPYRKALSFDQAIAELKKWAGTQFDPTLVKLFIEMVS